MWPFQVHRGHWTARAAYSLMLPCIATRTLCALGLIGFMLHWNGWCQSRHTHKRNKCKRPYNARKVSREECSFMFWDGSEDVAVEVGRIFHLGTAPKVPVYSCTFELWSIVHILFIIINEDYSIYWGRFRVFNSWQIIYSCGIMYTLLVVSRNRIYPWSI